MRIQMRIQRRIRSQKRTPIRIPSHRRGGIPRSHRALSLARETGVRERRAPDGRYRTAPLRGLFSHATGGFYHDGRFATLADVVTHYDTALNLGLTASQQSDLVQYLLSL